MAPDLKRDSISRGLRGVGTDTTRERRAPRRPLPETRQHTTGEMLTRLSRGDIHTHTHTHTYTHTHAQNNRPVPSRRQIFDAVDFPSAPVSIAATSARTSRHFFPARCHPLSGIISLLMLTGINLIMARSIIDLLPGSYPRTAPSPVLLDPIIAG